MWCRDNEQHEAFLPWILSSQLCEITFRALRSSRVTGSGVTCFTVLEAKNFFRRLDLSLATENSLQDVLVFPRHQKHLKPSELAPHIPVCLPENYEIENSVKEAFKKAVTRAMAFNLIKSRFTTIPRASLQCVSKSDMELNDEEDDQDCDGENASGL